MTDPDNSSSTAYDYSIGYAFFGNTLGLEIGRTELGRHTVEIGNAYTIGVNIAGTVVSVFYQPTYALDSIFQPYLKLSTMLSTIALDNDYNYTIVTESPEAGNDYLGVFNLGLE